MKKLFLLGLVATFFFGMQSVQAESIEGISATYTTDSKIFLQWDHLADELLYDTDGYSVQFGPYESKMRNVDPSNLYLDKRTNNVSLRGAEFERNTWYYFRVYTYVRDGRSYVLTNGSKILKWKYFSNGETEDEIIEPNDPVIADSTNDIGIDFGKLGVVRYDTYATFSWSRPNLAKSDADGVVIVLKESGSSDTLVELEANLDMNSGKITGLTPNTSYEAKGYFYKHVGGENQKFGAGTAETFITQPAFSAAQKARIDRLRSQGLIRDGALTTVAVGGSTSSTTTSTDTSTTTSTSTTSSTATSSTTSSSSYTRTQIENKIKELETELQKWRLELKKLGTSSNSSFNRTTTTTTTKSKAKETLRERMCRVLKRNCN